MFCVNWEHLKLSEWSERTAVADGVYSAINTSGLCDHRLTTLTGDAKQQSHQQTE